MRTNYADERLSSIERMKADHRARCSGCSICQPDRFPKVGPSKVVLTQAAELHSPHPYSPPRPVDPNVDVAKAFLASYTGSWSFMLTLKAEMAEGNLRFTDRVVEVILNCKRREEQWAIERAAKAQHEMAAPIVAKLPEGRRYYAVDNADGQVTFLRITRTNRDWTYVDQIIGGGAGVDSSATPRARVMPDGKYLGTFQSLYEKVVSDPEAAMARFGHEIGRCGYCGRTLTDAESRARGIGPVCARQAGF